MFNFFDENVADVTEIGEKMDSRGRLSLRGQILRLQNLSAHSSGFATRNLAKTFGKAGIMITWFEISRIIMRFGNILRTTHESG